MYVFSCRPDIFLYTKCIINAYNILNTGVCLAEDIKAWKVRRVVARGKNKANNATCMNVTTLYEGGLAVLPQKNFEKKLTLKPCILRLLGSPVEGGGIRFSHQICTDLKNGPDELQKAWKPEKPEKGWPLLQYQYKYHNEHAMYCTFDTHIVKPFQRIVLLVSLLVI